MSKQSFGRGALAAGGLAAILASAYCLGSLVLVALGFSAAWIGNLTALEPYRPVFVSGALVALVLAYCRIRLQNDFLGRGGIGRDKRRLPLHSSTVYRKAHRHESSPPSFCVTFSAPAWAGTKTVTLSVSRMTCTAWEALVTYDDAKTGVEALTKATEGAG